MILNACVINKSMIPESICKKCKQKCRHAGKLTVAERIQKKKKKEK